MADRLVLEDGTVFYGKAIGAKKDCFGEVIFFTGMTGYQEIITDPSYYGYLLTMTYPLIGNYGINREDFESSRPTIKGLIAREICNEPSNWRLDKKMVDYLLSNNIVGLTEVDTRALTRHLCQNGIMKGTITTSDAPTKEITSRMASLPSPSDQDLVKFVSTVKPYTLKEKGIKVVVVDLGLKQSIARNLNQFDLSIRVVPASASADEIIAEKPRAIIFSNGPGEPSQIPYVVKTAQQLLGKCPLVGVCLGHLVLAQALGINIKPLKFGHYGINQPVKNLQTGRVEITAQSHRFTIDEDSLNLEDVIVTHRNINDGSIEGLAHRRYPLISIQYYPQPYPAASKNGYIYNHIMKMAGEGIKNA